MSHWINGAIDGPSNHLQGSAGDLEGPMGVWGMPGGRRLSSDDS